MTWIVTGATGLLGPYLIEAIHPLYKVSASRIELTDGGRMNHYIDFIQPSVFVHAAAYTDVDGCEENPRKAEEVNHRAVEDIVRALEPSTKLVYISTDMVYPDTDGPHSERDVARPVNTYALTKLLGEVAAMKHPNTLVLRTNFFGPSKNQRKSFSDWVLEDTNNGHSEREYYNDIFFSPLHMRTLAELVVECCERNLIGIFNAGSQYGTSKHEFASILSGNMKKAAKSNFRVPRPHDMTMDVSRLERVLGREMPTLGEEIGKMRNGS